MTRPASLIDAALARMHAERTRIVAAIDEAEIGLRVERARLAGIEIAIEAAKEDAAAAVEERAPRQPPGAVERAIMDMKGSAGETAETIAQVSGHKLASVRAALRRMVQTGAVDKTGELYRAHRAESQADAAE